MPHAVVIPISTLEIIYDTSLTRVKTSYEQSASSHIGSCAQSPRAHTNKPAAARASSVQDTGALRTRRAQRSCAANTTHTLRGHTALNSRGAPRSRAVYELV